MAKLTKEQIAQLEIKAKEYEEQDPPLTQAEIQSKLDAEKENMLASNVVVDETFDTSLKIDQSKEDATQVDAIVEQKNTASESDDTSSESQEDKKEKKGWNDKKDDNGDLVDLSFTDFKDVGGMLGLTAEGDMVEKLSKAYPEEDGYKFEQSEVGKDAVKMTRPDGGEHTVFLPTSMFSGTSKNWGQVYGEVNDFISGSDQYTPVSDIEEMGEEIEKQEKKKAEPTTYEVPIIDSETGKVKMQTVINKPISYKKETEYNNRSKNPVHANITRPTYEEGSRYAYGKGEEDRIFNGPADRGVLELEEMYGTHGFSFEKSMGRYDDEIIVTHDDSGETTRFSVNANGMFASKINDPGVSRAILTSFIDDKMGDLRVDYDEREKQDKAVTSRGKMVKEMSKWTSLNATETKGIQDAVGEVDLFKPVVSSVNISREPKFPQMIERTTQPYEDEIKQAEAMLNKEGMKTDRLAVETLARKIIANNMKNKIKDKKDRAYMENMSDEDQAKLRVGQVEVGRKLDVDIFLNETKDERLKSDFKNSSEFKNWTAFNEIMSDPEGSFSNPNDLEMVDVSLNGNVKKVPKEIYEKASADHQYLLSQAKAIEANDNELIGNIEKLRDIDHQWDAVKRNYDDWDKFGTNLGINTVNIFTDFAYGANKMMGGDLNPTVARQIDQMQIDNVNRMNAIKNRYKKDISFEDMKHGDNAGEWYAQFVSQQAPVLGAMMAPGGLWTMYGMSAGQKWTQDVQEEIMTGERKAGWKKYLGMHGYALAEVLPEKYITMPMIKEGKKMFSKGGRKELFNNSYEKFWSKEYAEFAGRNVIAKPILEGGSEGFTSFSQNIINGDNPFLNMEEAVYGGGVMGLFFGGAPMMKSVFNATISDHRQNEEIRDNLRAHNEIAQQNSNLRVKLRLLENTDLYDAETQAQKIAEAESNIDINNQIMESIMDQNMDIQTQIEKRVSGITTSELRKYIGLTNQQEALKIKAAEIVDNKTIAESTKQKLLKNIKLEFDHIGSFKTMFKDKDAFGDSYALFQGSMKKEDKQRREELRATASQNLQDRGVEKPTKEQISDETRKIFKVQEAEQEVADAKKRTKLGKSVVVAKTKEDAINNINKNIDDLIAAEQKKEKPNQARIDEYQDARQDAVAEVNRGMHGVNMIDPKGGPRIPMVVIQNMADAGRTEIRTHELGHTIFAESIGENPAMYDYLAGEVMHWAKENSPAIYKRLISRTETDQSGQMISEEVLSVFLESVADGKYDEALAKNQSFFPKMFGYLSGKAVSEQSGSNFDFDFRGEKDVINFMVGLGKKLKSGDLSMKDRKAIQSKFARNDKGIEPAFKFSKEASEKVQSIYESEGVAGAFDIIEQFKPIVSKIVEKRREAPNFDRQLLMDEIETGKRGLYDLIQEYKPESGVPLAAFINTYLPSRAIEASKRVLGEEFTDDISERVDVAADEVVETGEVATKKTKIHEKLGDDAVAINKEVKKIIPDLDGKTFKNLTDLTPDLTQEMFGIAPKPGNLTKTDVRNAQMFINKNAETLIKMLPEGATSSGTSTGVQKVLLDAFYNKADRVKMIKTGSKAGLAVQIKRSNITVPEFLEVFGVTERGNPNLYRKDSNTSARIKALVSQTGKMLTNQAVRENIQRLDNVSDQVRLSLEDGKSIFMFSKEGVDSKYGDFVNEVSGSNTLDKKSIGNAVDRVYKEGDITPKERKAIINKVYKLATNYGNILKKHSLLPNVRVELPQTISEILMNDFISENVDFALKPALEKILPKDKNGNTINIGTHYLNINRINKQRQAILDLATEMSKTMPTEQVLETVLKYYSGMFVGASKIADGRFIVENGEVIDDPNWETYRDNYIREKDEAPTNRKQVFQNMEDFIDNFVKKVPGVTNVTVKRSKPDKNTGTVKVSIDKVFIDGQATSINTKLLAENSNAGLTDKNFTGREAQSLEARNEVKRLLDFYWKRVANNDSSLDGADLGMIMTSMGAGMSSLMRRAANLKYLGIGVENVDKANRGKELEYEHMIPQVEMTLKVLESYMNSGKLDPSVWEGYHVAIIPKSMDKVLIENKLRSRSPIQGNRYYNMETFGDKRLVPIKSIDPADNGKIIGEDFVKAGNILNGTIKDLQNLNSLSRAYKFSRETHAKRKGISIWDFDDTLARTKSGVRYTLPNPDGSPQSSRKVIFMAGGAGSGKSNVIGKLGLMDKGYKIVNSDISLEWLKKNSGLPADMKDLTSEQLSQLGKLQGEARNIAKRKKMKFQGNGSGIVVDGTGGSINAMKKQVQEFKDKGYDVQMVFVETSLNTALERNRNRSERSLRDGIVKRNHEKVQGNKEAFKRLFGNNFAEVKTDKLGINDAMPSDLTSKLDNFTNGYIKGRLDAAEFADKGSELLANGAEFDFSEFNKVVGGQTGPLFDKAMGRAKKFGTKDQFILTARPAASAPAIFEFLKSQGLNIPLENITGLANSTPESKAIWIADKVGEGYNDIYFADDALQNVQAVQNVLDQMDVKSDVQLAKYKFSKEIDFKFNKIIEGTTGIRSELQFSNAQAKIRGAKTKYKSIIPPSAQDFAGLLYSFLGKGKQGEADMAFFKKALIDPFARGINELNASKQRAANDYKNLNKEFPKVKKLLKKKLENSEFNHDQAIRVYLWDKSGFSVPGLSKRDLATMTDFVEANEDIKAYADAIGVISKKEEGYSMPGDFWLAENITSDLLSDGAIGETRESFLGEWQQNADVIFSPENLNKIEAVYGSKFREALEDSLYRMRTGRNRPTGGGRIMNMYMNWVNNSVGAIMFFNMRSALLQTISATNYINWSDNNPVKAAAAFANQPQFWKDFSYLFNSDFLKQRRSGNQRGINEAELSAAVAGAENKAKAAIAWLLKKGFLPTQIADSFAIASGGSSFYRNRIKKYLKEGMNQVEAEKQAFLDFQETTEVAQQSARPDMISQQQASPLGRLILSFQNTPMQYARIMNKAARDIGNGRGDFKTHVSKIVYYGVVQSIIFGSLQSALFAALGEDEEEEFDGKKERIINGMIDSVLSGIGYGGKAISTAKNTVKEYLKQRDKGFRSDHTYTILQLLGFSPPIGSKLRKIYSSIQTEKFNKDVFMKRGFTLDNPIWQAVGNTIEGVTNVPLGRMANKMLNIDNALDENNKMWERVALVLGWNTWDLGIRDPDIEAIKEEVKGQKKKEAKEKREKKKKLKKELKNNPAYIGPNIPGLTEEVEEVEEQKQQEEAMCSATTSSGNPCKNKAVKNGKCWSHVEGDTDRDGDGIMEVRCSGVTGKGTQCKNKTENASGKCYAHQ